MCFRHAAELAGKGARISTAIVSKDNDEWECKLCEKEDKMALKEEQETMESYKCECDEDCECDDE